MRKLTEQKERVDNLERSMQQLTEEFGREREMMKAAAERKHQELDNERTALLRTVKCAAPRCPPLALRSSPFPDPIYQLTVST